MPYNAPIELANFLNTQPRQMVVANLYTITTVGGVVLRYCSWPVPITLYGFTFLPGPPHFTMSSIDHSVGLSTDKVTLSMIWPENFAIGSTLPLLTRINAGEFVLASVQVSRAYAPDEHNSWIGSLVRFSGEITDIQAIQTGSCSITVSSYTHRLDVQWPQNVVEVYCGNQLYDSGCKANPASFTANLVVQSGTTATSIYGNSSIGDHYYDKGRIVFTSGKLIGYSRMVRLYAAGVFRLIGPLPYTPEVGDTFNAIKGCDKLMTTCSGVFNNLVNFAGFPFVPPPEAAL